MKLGMIPKKTNPTDLKLAKELYTDLYTGGNLTTLQFSNAYKYRGVQEGDGSRQPPDLWRHRPIWLLSCGKIPKATQSLQPEVLYSGHWSLC